MIKKILAVVLALMCVAGAFAGCGDMSSSGSSALGGSEHSSVGGGSQSSEEESSQPEVILTIYAYEADGEGFWSAAADKFEELNGGVEVQVKSGSDIASVLREDILSGKSPDLVYLPSYEGSGVTEALINDKALADISDVMAEISGKLAEGVYNTAFCKPYGDGKTYIAPYGSALEGIWYNSERFSDPSSFGDTFEEFVAFADELKSSSKLFGFAGDELKTLRAIVAPVLKSYVGPEKTEALYKMDASVWSDSGVTDAIDLIDSLTYDQDVELDSIAYSQVELMCALAKGDVAFGLFSDAEKVYKEALEKHGNPGEDASKEDKELADALKALELEYLPMPAAKEGGECVGYARTGELYVPIEAKEAALAKEFIKFLYTDEAARLLSEKTELAVPFNDAFDGVVPYVYRTPALSGASDDFEEIFYECIAKMLTNNMAVSKLTSNMKSAVDTLDDYILK